MGCGDLRLLNGRAHRCVEAGKRAGLVKLTEPRAVLVYQLEWRNPTILRGRQLKCRATT